MNNRCYIYNKTTLELIIALNYSKEELEANPHWYSGWDAETMVISTFQAVYPKLDENGEIVEKKRVELIQEGIEELRDGEYIDNGILIEVPCTEKFLKRVWNKVTHVWEEGATPEEIAEAAHDANVAFYNEELNFAGKAHTEYGCGIIGEAEFNEVKAYMASIDPYAPATVEEPAPKMRAMSFAVKSKPSRPSIFDRYQ